MHLDEIPETYVMREGASTRTADELLIVFVLDALDLGVELSPWGRETFHKASDALEANRSSRSGTAWFSDEDQGLRDDLVSLVSQVEADLETRDLFVTWEDGYVISSSEPDED